MKELGLSSFKSLLLPTTYSDSHSNWTITTHGQDWPVSMCYDKKGNIASNGRQLCWSTCAASSQLLCPEHLIPSGNCIAAVCLFKYRLFFNCGRQWGGSGGWDTIPQTHAHGLLYRKLIVEDLSEAQHGLLWLPDEQRVLFRELLNLRSVDHERWTCSDSRGPVRQAYFTP